MLDSSNYLSVQASITGNFSKYIPKMMLFKSSIQKAIIPMLSVEELQDIKDCRLNIGVIDKLGNIGKEQYRQLLRVAAIEGCNYFTFNIPNTICNKCKHIDKRYLHECPECHSEDVDYLTRVIGYMKRVSNFSQARQKEAAQRYYAPVR